MREKTFQVVQTVEALLKNGNMKRLDDQLLKHARALSEYIQLRQSSAQQMATNNIQMGTVEKKKNANNNNNQNLEEYAWNDSSSLFAQMKSHVFDPRGNVVYARTTRGEGGWSASERSSKRATKAGVSHMDSIFVLSPKTVGVLNSILDPTNRGVHFVYGRNWATLRLMAHILQTRHGWSLYTARDGTTPSKTPRFGFVNDLPDSNKTRFLDPRLADRRAKDFPAAAFASPMVTRVSAGGKRLKSSAFLLDAIENDANKYGTICKVVFATKDSYKGVNTKNLRHIHCITALPRWTDLLQLVGRGTRFKGHCGLPRKDRNVTVHTWRLEPPRGMVVSSAAHRILFPDDYIYDWSYAQYQRGFGTVIETLKSKSIDATLFGANFDKLNVLHRGLQERCDRGGTRTARNGNNNGVSSEQIAKMVGKMRLVNANTVQKMKTAELRAFLAKQYKRVKKIPRGGTKEQKRARKEAMDRWIDASLRKIRANGNAFRASRA